jgi:hypothetical protein
VRREEQRVLAGSLNVLTPSDKTPENDAIDLLNFRVDQAGVLRGTEAFSTLVNVALNVPVHTLMRLDTFTTTKAYAKGLLTIDFGGSPAYLIGAGDKLYCQYTAGLAPLVLLASGFSGNPLSIVLFNGTFWILDSVKQVKLDSLNLSNGSGTIVTSWLPAAPTTPVVAVANTSGDGPLSGTYTYYVTYVGRSGVDFSLLESAPGPGVTLAAAGGVVSILGLPYQPNLEGIRLYRSGGSLAHSYLVAIFSFVPSQPLWASYLTPDYPNINQAWWDTRSDALISGVGVVMPTSGAIGAPSAPTAAVSAMSGFPIVSGLVGTYQYYLTFVNSAGLETNPSPVSAAVTPSNGMVDLTLPVSPDPDTVRRRIYRTGGTLGNAYQVTELTDNTTTSFTDGISDLAITELGIAMPTTNDPPPTGGTSVGMVGPYLNRLLAWKDGRLFWSQEGVPLFPGSEDGSATGNWADVGLPDDWIVAITLHPRLAVIYKQRVIWRLEGDPDTGTLEGTDASAGALGKNAVANGGTVDYVLSQDGLFLFDLDQLQKICGKVDPIFTSAVNWLALGAQDLSTPIWSLAAPFARPFPPVVCAYLNGTVLVSDGVETALLYHVETGRWTRFSTGLGYPITAIAPWGSAYEYWIGDSRGNLSAAILPGGGIVAGSAPNVWQTRFLDQGLGDQDKYYQEVVLDAELNGKTATVYLFFDNSAAAPPRSAVLDPFKATFTGTVRQKFYIPLPEDLDGQPRISVRVELDESLTFVRPAIHGLYIYWSPEARDGVSFGTRVLDFHSEWIKTARRLAIDCKGTITLAIATDQPGELTATVFFKTIDAGPVRNIVQVRLPPNIRGRNWIVSVVTGSQSTARVYSLRAWMRTIGDGGPGAWAWEDWLTAPPAEQPDAE